MTFQVNSPAVSFQLALGGVVMQAPPPPFSPIDIFYQQRSAVLTLGSTGSLGATNDSRALALVPLFASAEMYFRRLLAKAIAACPICEEHAGTQQVSLGSIGALDKLERA